MKLTEGEVVRICQLYLEPCEYINKIFWEGILERDRGLFTLYYNVGQSGVHISNNHPPMFCKNRKLNFKSISNNFV